MTKNIDIKKNQDISIYIISNSIFKGEKHHHKSTTTTKNSILSNLCITHTYFFRLIFSFCYIKKAPFVYYFCNLPFGYSIIIQDFTLLLTLTTP